MSYTWNTKRGSGYLATEEDRVTHNSQEMSRKKMPHLAGAGGHTTGIRNKGTEAVLPEGEKQS